MENNVIPALRFPEFTDQWNSDKLGSIATFSKGKGISKADIDENGATECIRYGELYTVYSEVISEIKSKTNLDIDSLVLSDANDVIIPASGETQIDIATASCVLKAGVALSGDLNIIKSETDGVFLSYYLNNAKKYKIARLAQGISVVHLYSSQLASLNVNIPSPDEQTKISAFLMSIDKRIKILEKKKAELEHYKKGVMQKLFARTIRFKKDDGSDFPDWEEKKLGELGETFNGLTGKTKVDFGEGKPYIQYMQIFSNSQIDTSQFGLVKIEDGENQSKAQLGDVFFTTSSETPNEIGTSSVLTVEVDEVYLNSFCFGYRPNSLDELVPEFSQFFFRSENVRRKVIKLAQGSTRFNMSKLELVKIKFDFPKKDEQVKIANFLISIDKSIEKVGVQIEDSILFKQGLLQKMFV
ncbi:restriction endonuclease subunit S [Maribacter ulvicola]|uniref:Type I restriction enzyme, S subunit n=1 Tax=Maribacter ulvicola TaxID=228959 RepID=A0A1N6Q9J0_9FLAO|nr:restriction endonuclease subunit S [Maribacter ulvicola]SIQ13247.1 type I restriction enzyme, S subunit [Maribacter ulvicola]